MKADRFLGSHAERWSWRRSVRRLAAVTLAALLALPAGDARSAVSAGTISGVVRLGGHPKAGVTVAFIELQSGAVVRATSRQDGGFEVQAPDGEYAVTTESLAGLTVEKAPLRVTVAEGKPASADIELVAVPSAVPEEPAAGAPETAVPVVAAPEGQTPPPTPAAAEESGFAETSGKGAQIQFKPVTCFVAGEFPLLDAEVKPIESVARARVYFKPAGGTAFFYVEMSQDQGRYVGKLPRPRVEASPITYYLQSTTTEFEESQTREIAAAVVRDKSDCEGRPVAAFGPQGPVTVFSAATGTSIASPFGFAAAAASTLLVGAVAIIAGGAAAAGIVGGVVVRPGTGATPPANAFEPSPIPVPTAAPAPTPTPITTFR